MYWMYTLTITMDAEKSRKLDKLRRQQIITNDEYDAKMAEETQRVELELKALLDRFAIQHSVTIEIRP